MCDFSLYSVRSRPAQVGDKLVTHNFGTGTRGFAAVDDLNLAVCLMPGTELAFSREVAILPSGLLGWKTKTTNHRTAIFRQVNKERWSSPLKWCGAQYSQKSTRVFNPTSLGRHSTMQETFGRTPRPSIECNRVTGFAPIRTG